MSLVRARKLALLFQTRQNAHLNHLILSGVTHARFMGKPYITNARQLHSSMQRAVFKTKLNEKPLKLKVSAEPFRRFKDPSRAVPPRYIQGPTLPALRVVVQAMQNSNTNMDTKEIWDAIHKNALGAEYRFPEPPPLTNPKMRAANLEPTYPTHPVRSTRYLKTVLLATLEANGRVKKVHSTRPPSEEEMPVLEKKQKRIEKRNKKKLIAGEEPNGLIPTEVGTWVWELIPPNEGITPVEQRSTIPMSRADTIWMHSLDAETLRGFENQPFGNQEGPESTSIAKYQPNHEDGDKAGRRDSAQPTSRTTELEHNLAKNLVQKWQTPILKDEESSLKAGVAPVTGWKTRTNGEGNKVVDWNISEQDKREKLIRRKHLLSMAPKSLHSSTADWSQKEEGDSEIKVTTSGKEGDLFDDGHSIEAPVSAKKVITPLLQGRDKPHLNPTEPEYRQSRRGIDGIPISLQDPRRRQFGFHYGLPKQKELLRAANARGWDQEEWPVESQPPRDFSHLSVRRKRTREEQNATTIRLLKHTARSQKVSSKSLVAAPARRVKWTERGTTKARV